MEVGRAINPQGSEAQTASLIRPRLRLVRITRRPVWERMRTLKPETRLRLRLVPPRVRLVILMLWLPAVQSWKLYQSVHIN